MGRSGREGKEWRYFPFVISHFSFFIFTLARHEWLNAPLPADLNEKWKMRNGKWKITAFHHPPHPSLLPGTSG
jgi:hypothetical protein